MALLDKIITNTQELDGIIDYVNKKHVVFFDMTKNDSPDIVLLVISWKCTYAEKMRFSVFKDIFFPNVEIPVILIPKKDIVQPSDLMETIPPKPKRKRVRKQS